MDVHAGQPPLDVEGALEIALGDRDFLKELIDLFVRESDPAIDRLSRAVQAREADTVMKIAHSLKSSSGNLRADLIRDFAFQLEQMGRSQKLDGAQQVFNDLHHEYQRLVSFASSLTL